MYPFQKQTEEESNSLLDEKDVVRLIKSSIFEKPSMLVKR